MLRKTRGIRPAALGKRMTANLGMTRREGKQLASLLSEGKTVKIETANGRWIRTIYLPERKHLNQENALFRLNCRAQGGNTIYYNGKQLLISEGYDVVFQFIKGVWCIIRKIKILFPNFK